MTKSNMSRRSLIQGGVGLTVANLIPGTTPLAFAASMEERTVAAAKAAGAADVSGPSCPDTKTSEIRGPNCAAVLL